MIDLLHEFELLDSSPFANLRLSQSTQSKQTASADQQKLADQQPAEKQLVKQEEKSSASTVNVVQRSPRQIIPAKRKISQRSPSPTSDAGPTPDADWSSSAVDTASTVSDGQSDSSTGQAAPAGHKRFLIRRKVKPRPPTSRPPKTPEPQAMVGVVPATPSPRTGPSQPQVNVGVKVVVPSPKTRIPASRSQRDEEPPSPPDNPFYAVDERYPYLDYSARPAAAFARPARVNNVVNRSDVPFFKSAPLDTLKAAWSVAPKSSMTMLQGRLNKRLQSISGPAITFNISDAKLALLSTNFGFLNDYVLRDGVQRVDEGFNSGCNCLIGKCDPTDCDCLFDEEDRDEKIRTYHEVNGQFLLHPSFLARRSKIVECCDLCTCRGKCWNTVVQQGRQVRFEIFDTGNRGLGTFHLRLLPVYPLRLRVYKWLH